MHTIWLSLDTGIDDCFALLLLLKEKDIKVDGIIATYGNVELEKTFKNTRDVLHFAGYDDIKVYKGSSSPLVDKPCYGYDCHGKNGINNIKLAASTAPTEKENAFDAFYNSAKKLNGQMELIMLGPSSDFANTYFRHPDIVKYLKRVVIMGGSFSGGNRTSQAEFNIYADPISSEILFESGIDIVMAPLDVTLKSYFDLDDIKTLSSFDNKLSHLFEKMSVNIMKFYYKNSGYHRFFFHDACPIVYLNDETIFKSIKCHVKIETKSKLAYGKTISDYDCDIPYEGKEVTALIDVDRQRFVKHCFDIYKTY